MLLGSDHDGAAAGSCRRGVPGQPANASGPMARAARPWPRSRCHPPSPRSEGGPSRAARPWPRSRCRPLSPRSEGVPSRAARPWPRSRYLPDLSASDSTLSRAAPGRRNHPRHRLRDRGARAFSQNRTESHVWLQYKGHPLTTGVLCRTDGYAFYESTISALLQMSYDRQ